MTCDLSLITSTEDSEELLSASSEDELDEDELDESSLSESDSMDCWSSQLSGGRSPLLESIFGWSIRSSWRSACVIGGARKEGSGRGCFAPLDCDVKGLQPALISTRISR